MMAYQKMPFFGAKLQLFFAKKELWQPDSIVKFAFNDCHNR